MLRGLEDALEIPVTWDFLEHQGLWVLKVSEIIVSDVFMLLNASGWLAVTCLIMNG